MTIHEAPPQATQPKEQPRTLDDIFDVGPGIPHEIKRAIKSLIKTLEPFESLACEIAENPDPETQSAFLAILEQSGALSEKFLIQFSDIATSLAEYVATVRSSNSVSSAVQDIDRVLDRAILRMKKYGRPLGERVTQEIVRYVTFIIHQTNIEAQNKNGSVFNKKLQAAKYSPEAERMRREYVALSTLGKATLQPVHPLNPERKHASGTYTFKEMIALLRDIDFLPGTGFHTQITIPSSGVFQKKLLADLTVHVVNNRDPLSIAQFKITFQGEEITGNVSRLDGDINAHGCRFLKIHDVLRIAGVANASYFIQEAIISVMFIAWERGVLRETPYISVTQHEDPVKTTSTVTFQEIPDTTQPVDSADPKPQHDTTTKNITSTTGEKTRFIKGRKEKVKNISWTKVLRRFDQMGVIISFEKHPRLTYNEIPFTYVNEHDGETKRHAKRLRAALKKFGISEEDFLSGI